MVRKPTNLMFLGSYRSIRMDSQHNKRAFRSRNGTPSIIDVEVSCFQSYTCPGSPKTVNLLAWLRSRKYADAVLELRKCSKLERDRLKAKLPAITPSGIFDRREAAGLLQHSGLIQFDIDFHDNMHVSNFSALKAQICNIENVAYCGLSVSGQGYWGLVPIANPEKHKQHFELLQNVFNNFGIVLDKKPSNPASLRGYSFDDGAYFNHAAKPLQLYVQAPKRVSITPILDRREEYQQVEQLVQVIEASGKDITQGYDVWFQIGCSLSNTFGEDGREFFHRISQFYEGYSVRNTDYHFNQYLKYQYPYTIGTLLHHVKNAGVGLSGRAIPTAPVSMREFTRPPVLSDPDHEPVEEVQSLQLETAPKTVHEPIKLKDEKMPVYSVSDRGMAPVITSLSVIDELEDFFATAILPPTPIQLNQCETITDLAAFIQSHLHTARTYANNKCFEPYYNRLLQLKCICEEGTGKEAA